MKTKRKVVVIGGGTGTYTALSGLKKYPLDLTAIISMMDSGGSNRVIRDEFGLLPTSDIRQCIVALASDESHKILRDLFTYRYTSGTGISGMTFGNLFMAAVTDIYKSQEEAIDKTCELLGVTGKILPVTLSKTNLLAKYDNGEEVLGEHDIDEPGMELGKHRIIDLRLIPKAQANKKALKAIASADYIVLGPGDLYTSIICNLVVDGVASAIKRSSAKKIYVVNLMTKFGETGGLTAKDHVAEIEKYIGTKLDYVLVNSSKVYPKGILKKYLTEKAEPVVDDLGSGNGRKVTRCELVSDIVYKVGISDRLKRSLIRHNSVKLAKAVVELINIPS